MLISTNREAETSVFEALLAQMVDSLKAQTEKDPALGLSLHGQKLEKYSFDLLRELAHGTSFEGSIELVSGQMFPDIVAKRFWGVEVKTTKSASWRSIGSSVAEGTRIEDIERIYLLFGRLGKPIDFRCRLYQECLSGVAVTHSPRYTIDMDLSEGETFFDKLQIPYDVLRKQSDPIRPIVDYFRKSLKPGETTWWLSSSDSKATHAVVRLWSSLSKEDAHRLKILGFCLFPELLSASQSKFHRMLLWLSTQEGVVVGNLRDQYTSGGRVTFAWRDRVYTLPQILHRLLLSLLEILRCLEELDITLLQEYWGDSEMIDRKSIWIKLVCSYAAEISDFPLEDYIAEVYSQE